MADTTVQESLLNRIPLELQEQINAAPGDIHEKVHQRELLMIEQIKHFSNIRIEELANFGRNLLEQRKFEDAQAKPAVPSDKPALKSIVKRVPSKMEKRVSFSELPPEVETFYKNMEDDDSSFDDSDDCEVFTPEVFTFADKTNESDQLESPMDISPQGSIDEYENEREPQQNPELEPEPEPGHEAEHEAEHEHEHSAEQEPPQESSISPSASFIYTPSPNEPAISFDDAYGSTTPNSPVPDAEEPDTPLVLSPSPPKPSNWVGSAPINIGMEALKQQFAAKLSPESESEKLGPLNPENMSFSQRMAWEDRPK